MYKIMWKGEEVDSTDNFKNELYLKAEYNLAFGGGVTIEGEE